MGARRRLSLPLAYTALFLGFAFLTPITVDGQTGEALGAVAQRPAGPSDAPPAAKAPEPQPPSPPRPTIPSTVRRLPEALAGTLTRPGVSFELHPTISLSEEYTDNFGRAARDRQENFRTSLSPGATLIVRGARRTGALSAGLSIAHDSATDEVELLTTGVIGGEFSFEVTPRWRLTVSDFLARTDEPALADDLRLRRERQTFTSNSFSLTSDYTPGRVDTQQYYRLSTFFNEDGDDTLSHTVGGGVGTVILARTSVNAGYEYLDSNVSDRDITGHQFTASLARLLGAFASTGVSASYALRDVSGSNQAEARDFRDFTIWSVSLFGTYALPERWSVSASVGYSRLDLDDGSDESPIATLAISYFLVRATASLILDQGFSETFATGENLGVVKTRGVTGRLTFPVTPFIGGTAEAFYRENTFTGVAGGPGRDTEEVWGASLDVAVQLRRWLTMGLRYAHTETSASTRGGDIVENQAQIAFHASF